MELAALFVGKLLDYTVNPMGRQFGYLIFYRSNIKALKEQLEELEAKRSAVQHSITEATTNEEKIEVQVQNWMRKVEGITGQAQQFYEEESQAKSGCTRTSCPNLSSRHQLSRRAKKMALQVAEIRGNGNFDRISYRDSPQWIHASITGKTNEGFESRMSVITQIMEALGDPNVTMIGLCGLGGVGKTTIVKEVAKRVKEEKMFEKVIMAKVSDDPNLEKIQGQIAEMMGMKFDERNEILRAFRLHERLKEEKNMLLILDDLWKKLELDEVGIPFDDDNKNKEQCKILLTSRNGKLLSEQMKCKRNIKVDVLSEAEAWELFRGIAELPDDSNLHFVANKIVQRCGGLPVSIVAAAGALRNKDLTQWKDALERLGNPLRRNITGIKEADSILRLSYDHLSQELQPIFLLSAMLSHNPLNLDLLMYSLGLGLLQGIDTMEKARDGIEALVSKLKASNLLLDSFSSDCFTMHDVVRDVTLSIASTEQHTLVVRHRRSYEWPDKNLLEGYTRILLDKSDINDLPQELCCPRLELFLLNSMDSNLRVPSTFFKSMNELKAIGFTDTHFPSLPSSLGLLEKLRTLCLHSCVLEDIAEIGNLKYLKVLSLAHSIIKQLPRELAQLTCLQMLNLAHCSKLEVIPPKLLSSLKRLEVLYMENSFKHWEAEGSSKGNENASLAELKHLTSLSSLHIHIPDASVLPKDLFLGNSLERYKILIGEDWEWLGKYETSKTLKLKLQSSSHLEHGIQKLLESVEDLHLEELNGITNVLYDLDWRGFPQLKHLWIQNNDQIEYIVINSTRLVGAFPYVETLNLHHLKGLKKLCQGRIMAASFQNLRVIKVKNCDELKSIFSILTVGLFCQLVEINIVGCNSMKGIVVSANEDSLDQQKLAFHVIFHQLRYLKMKDLPTLAAFYFEENAIHDKSNKVSNSLFSNKVSFPNLETLKLFSINNLIPSIWDDRLTQNSFGNLKTLLVRKCGFLVKLVPLHVLNSLRNLEELKVLDCELLEMVFDFEELSGYKETKLSWVVPLKKLELFSLPKLKHVWSNDPLEIVSFQSLRHVEASCCKRLTSIFPASIAKSMLHLEQLVIFHCGIEVIVAKDEVSESGAATFVFPKLTNLRLWRLQNLRNFYPHRHTSEWPCLQHLVIRDCDEIEIFQKEVSSSSRIFQEEAPHIKYPLFFHEKDIPNLQALTLNEKHGDMMWNGQFPAYHFDKVKKLKLRLCGTATFPHGLYNRFQNLEELILTGCVKEIFSCMEPLGDDVGQVAPFRKLVLLEMRELKHIWNVKHSQLHLILQNVESLTISFCPDLISLGPSFISFRNLTDISVNCCSRLTSLFASSTAKSLVQLTGLRIKDCLMIEEITTNQGQDHEEKEIVFNKLASLELERLLRLKSFCSHNYTFMFPSLHKVTIIHCPQLSMFCPGDIHTPLLKGVKVQENETLWETDLNKTTQLLYTRKIRNSLLWLYSTAKGVSQLRELVIQSCGVEIIVAEDEASGESPSFVFPQLTRLELWKLPIISRVSIHKDILLNGHNSDIYLCTSVKI